MKIPEMNKVYVLNPHYHLRHDIHRVALFSSTGDRYRLLPELAYFYSPAASCHAEIFFHV